MHYSTRLRWIKPGLDQELAGLRHALADISEGEPVQGDLEVVRQSLGRLRNVLELVSIYGAALLMEEMEALAVALEGGRVEQREDGLRLLIQGVLQLPHYLERVQGSGQDVPLLLMPLLNDIRAVLRRRLLSETSLFSPDLGTTIPDLPPSPVTHGAITVAALRAYAKRLRSYYQRGLVDWFRDEESAGLRTITAVLRHLEKLSGNSPLGALWWVALGVVAALRDGSLPGGVSVKLLMGQLDLQIRGLAEGGVAQLDHPPPPELLKNLLFYVGRYRSRQRRAQRTIELYRLDELLPEDDADGFLGPGLEVLDTVNDALSHDLARVKDVLDLFVRSDDAALENLRPTVGALARVADTLALLGLGGARQTVLDQAQRIQGYLDRSETPGNDELMAIAGGLLEVDSALSALASRGLDEALRDEKAGRQVTALKDHAHGRVVVAAVSEIRVELVAIKEGIEAHLAAPGSSHRLAEVQTYFRRAMGGLTILGLEPLAELMGECRRYVRERVEANAPRLPPAASLDALAKSVMSVDYFLEGFLEGRLDTDEIVDGLRASVAALELQPDMDVEEELDFGENNEELELAPPPAERPEVEEPLATPEVDEEYGAGDEGEEITLSSDTGGEAEAGDEAREPAPADMPGPMRAGLQDASERLHRMDAAEERDEEITEIFLEEAAETLVTIEEALSRWRDDPQSHESVGVIRRGFHTLKGSGRLVGATHVGELAWALERLLNRLIDGALGHSPAIPELVAEAREVMPDLVAAFRDRQTPSDAYRELVRRADGLADGPPPGPGGGGTGNGGAGPGGPSAGSGEAAAEDGAGGPAARAADGMDEGMLTVFIPEAEGVLASLREACAQLTLAGGGPVEERLVRHCHTLKGITRLAGLEEHSRLYGALEAGLDAHHVAQRPVAFETCALLEESESVLARTLEALRARRVPEPPPVGLMERAETLAALPVGGGEGAGPSGEEDELAAELRQVFVEEAEEIQQSCDQLLERWTDHDVEGSVLAELLRLLHTLKGGARMAELGPMVTLSHSLETLLRRLSEGRVAPSGEGKDVLQQGLDGIALMLDQVKAERPLAEPAGLTESIEAVAAGRRSLPPVEARAPAVGGVREPPPAYGVTVLQDPPVVSLVTDRMEGEGEAGAVPVEVEKIAVGVDLLDQLVSASGEISISRSQVEQQVSELGGAIKEMEQTIYRLRSQLRRLDIETESQILYRRERAAEQPENAAFDPLELDRYTELQQLSRGLTESVADLASIQGQLTDLVKGSETSLLQQSRLSSDLQARLMTTRMVPFARFMPRLRRLVRQTAKELGKQVELHVVGQEEELDHSIIGPVVAALEHMLNNAVDHAIEAPAERQAAGKAVAGTLQLAIERDHNDVIVRLSDDGRGMDLAAIRRQAEERGLLDAGVEIADDELTQFVFEQAFSTAREVTRISGRGVGLDVVNAAINQLGGALAVSTGAGAGTTFTVRLPTTISVSQALMVQVEEEQFGLPLSHLEGVMRMSRRDVDALLEERSPRLSYLGEDYQAFQLGNILGVGRTAPSAALLRRVPVLFVRVAERRMAFMVHGLGGRQEIVIKPVGPQIGTVGWIRGATVLGDGRVVLVIDLPALVRIAATQPAHRARARRALGAERPATKPPLVLVVDDSLTVRRVAGRFLERNGMEVMSARDGVEALALLQDRAPDILLLDVEMPRMDGYELATSIRNDDRLCHLPIIMITSRSGQKHSERARAIGVDHYMSKPYQEGELLERITALTGAGHA